MVDGINGYKLIEHLLLLSFSKEWAFARQEWFLDHIYYIEKGDECETCSCGHFPIQEVCVIRNIENDNIAIVGNVCVKKFIDQIDSGTLFDGLRRIIKDLSSGPSKDLIDYAYGKSYINEREYKFCNDRYGKRKFSGKQQEIRKKINSKIMQMIIKTNI